MDFDVLIMGSDANAYYMARCCHEAFGKRAYLIAPYYRAFTKYSNILNISYDESIWEEKGFLNALKNFKINHPGKVLLIAANETYVRFISKNKDILEKDFYFNVPDIDIILSLIEKETFYKTYKDSILTFPKTIYYDCKKNETLKDFDYPLILKPSNVILYNHIEFPGKKKIYKIESKKELEEVIKNIKKGGYDDTLIIQEFIEGDDSYLFDAVCYCDRNKSAKLVSFAQIGLQEHASKMVGNAACLINGYNTYDGNVNEMINTIREFMESISYQGFAEFDMKYDAKEKKFKVLEINARQGRCSYYFKEAGYNLVEVLVKDLIYKEEIKKDNVLKKVYLSFVSKGIVKKYVKNETFKKEILKHWKKVKDPMKYRKDTSFLRKILLLKLKKRYKEEYKNGYWK